jgi:hypothetical protein
MRAHIKRILISISAPIAATMSWTAAAQTATTPATTSSSALVSPIAQPFSTNTSAEDQSHRSQAFHQTKQCFERSLALEHMQNATRLCSEQPLGSAGRTSCEKQTKGYDAKSFALRTSSTSTSCSQDAEATHRSFSNALVQAARAGDPDAQLCYFEWAGPFSTTEEMSLYKREATLYMQKAMERGDWRIVRLLATSPESVAHGGAGAMANLDIIGKWFTAYRADRLLQLGATGDYRQSLQWESDDAARHLSSGQVSNANTWAKQEFARHFAQSPQLSSAPIPCLNPGESTP